MRIKTITNSFSDRLGNPLEWAAVDKGILLCWVVVPLYLGYIVFAHLARHYLPEGELLDHRQAGHLLLFLYAITALSLLIGFLGLWLRRRHPDSLAFQHLAVQNYAISMPLLGYQIGSLSLASGIVLAGAPLLGFILFDRRAVLFGLASALAVVFGTSLLSATGQIDYAPILLPERLGGENSVFWVTSMLIVFSAPHIVVLFSLSAYVIHRWHLREAEIKRLAIIDPLTGIANRRWVLDELERELERAGREGSPLSLAMADLDHFKAVNDSCGHQAGDQVLKTVVERICRTLRKIDRPGRYGGEEFIIVLPDTDLENARKAAERCRHSIAAEPVRVNGDLAVGITASFGVSCSRHGEDTVASLIHRADQALYRAKQAGRNRTVTE